MTIMRVWQSFLARLPHIGGFVAVVVALFSAAAMAHFGYKFIVYEEADSASAFTGAGAVLASCISALVAYRSIAIIEEEKKPYPYPFIDTKSRHGLSLLKLRNAGGSAAHRIYIEWSGEVPFLKQGNGSEAKAINFANDESSPISILMPGDEHATVLGVHHWLADRIRNLDRELKGHIVFSDVRGRCYREPFCIDTSFFEWAIADETELLKAQYAVTQIPEQLGKVVKELQKISKERQV